MLKNEIEAMIGGIHISKTKSGTGSLKEVKNKEPTSSKKK